MKRTSKPARESVGSLIRRLGQPPSDLADELVDRFHEACLNLAAKGTPVTRVDLDDWTLGESGSLVYLSENRQGDSHSKTYEDFDPDDIPALLDAFRAQLSVASASKSVESFADRVTKNQRSRSIGSADRFAAHQVEETETSSLSTDEMLRREKLTNLFTDALVDRFGADTVFEPQLDESEVSRGPKVKTLERDRKFDWNLVLGVSTLAAVIAMVWTGVKLSQIRQERAELQRIADATKNGNVVDNRAVSSQAAARPTEQFSAAAEQTESRQDPIELIDLDDRPEVNDEALFTVKTSMGDLDEARVPLEDILDDLGDLKPVDTGKFDANPDQPSNSANPPDSATSLSAASLAQREKLGRFPDFSDETRRQLGIEALGGEATLDELLSNSEASAVGRSNELPIRSDLSRAITLPTLLKPNSETVVADSDVKLERIEFPVATPIELRVSANDSSLELFNTKRNAVIGTVLRDNDSTRIRWAEVASADARALLHGRLITRDGSRIYLRPANQTDPYPISLAVPVSKAVWPLAGNIVPSQTRLQLDLSVPDSIDLAWQTPFNSARPKAGEAIAILTPKDGETVSLAIKLRVECDRKLECRIELAGRLDDSLPWSRIDMASYSMMSAQLLDRRRNLMTRQGQFERTFRQAGLTDRSLMKGERRAYERQVELVEAIRQRMALLGMLLVEIDSAVKLDVNLFVQWPDESETQTLLRTVSDLDKASKTDNP